MTEPTEDDQALIRAVSAELAELSRQEYGATNENIALYGRALCRLGARERERSPAAPNIDLPSAARSLMVRTLPNVENPEYRFAVDGGLGLTIRTKSMASRYGALRRSAEYKGVPDSDATAKRRRPEAWQVFATLLVRSAGSHLFRLDRDEDDRPFAIQRTASWMKLSAARLVMRYATEVSIIARQPCQPTHLTHTQYFSDQRPGVLSVVPLFGCEVVGHQWDGNGIHYAELRLPNLLDAGERFTFMYEVVCNTMEPITPIAMITADRGELEAVNTVEFDPACCPESVWRFDDLMFLHLGSDKDVMQREVPLRGNPVVRVQHADVRHGLGYGVTWRWPST